MAVDPNDFKSTLSRWASGVTVVTTVVDGQRIGITASSFSSVSIDPPQILICVAKKLYTHSAIERCQSFSVNILSAEQKEWGMRFAGMMPELEDRFEGINCHKSVTGCPILSDALGWLDCKVNHAYDGGDHTIFVGGVMATGVSNSGEPILYYDRNWQKLGGPVGG